jgi:hypothetical protein
LAPSTLLEACCKLGAAEESFKYRKHLNTTAEGLPFAIEAAFAYCPDSDLRQVIVGVNFSVAIDSPFNRLGPFESLTSVLARQHVNFDDHVVVVLHYTSPRVDFSDRGKSAVALPREVGHAVAELIKAVTKEWCKQCRAELRHVSVEANRRERLLKEQRRPDKKGPVDGGRLGGLWRVATLWPEARHVLPAQQPDRRADSQVPAPRRNRNAPLLRARCCRAGATGGSLHPVPQ